MTSPAGADDAKSFCKCQCLCVCVCWAFCVTVYVYAHNVYDWKFECLCVLNNPWQPLGRWWWSGRCVCLGSNSAFHIPLWYSVLWPQETHSAEKRSVFYVLPLSAELLSLSCHFQNSGDFFSFLNVSLLLSVTPIAQSKFQFIFSTFIP